MANTYESKFKGVEVDEGVNIARNLAGTGGIEVKKTATGTINATVTIDGSGVKITPVSGIGTSTTDVMSQKAVTDELGKKQDAITTGTLLDVGAIRFSGLRESSIDYDMIGSRGAFRLPDYWSGPHILATRDDLPDTVQVTGIATGSVMSQKAVTDELGKKQDKLTVSSNIHINSLMADHITLGNYSSGTIFLYAQSGASGNVYFPKYGGYLATTNEVPAVVQIMGTGTTTVMSQKAVTDELGKKQDTITKDTSITAGTLKLSSKEGQYYYTTGAGSLVVEKNNEAITLGGSEASIYFRNRSQNLSRDIITVITNKFDGGYATFHIKTPQSINDQTVTFPNASGDVMISTDYAKDEIPKWIAFKKLGKSGIKAADVVTTGNVKTINGQSILGTGDITVGGGSAGVSSIGGKTGAITLGTGLSMNGNELSAEGGGGTTYYRHLLRSKYTHGSAGCDYQFYMTVISTQSSEAGGLTDLVLNSANITVGIDAAQSGAPRDYAGFVPAIMIENPDDPLNSTIFFVDTINNRSYAVAVEDTEFISDSVETL